MSVIGHVHTQGDDLSKSRVCTKIGHSGAGSKRRIGRCAANAVHTEFFKPPQLQSALLAAERRHLAADGKGGISQSSGHSRIENSGICQTNRDGAFPAVRRGPGRTHLPLPPVERTLSSSTGMDYVFSRYLLCLTVVATLACSISSFEVAMGNLGRLHSPEFHGEGMGFHRAQSLFALRQRDSG